MTDPTAGSNQWIHLCIPQRVGRSVSADKRSYTTERGREIHTLIEYEGHFLDR